MIRFDSTREISENKNETFKPYMSIKSSENLSEQEATDFISKTFEDAYNETEQDFFDRLASEVFNCSEDEIVIDYDIGEKDKSILESFRPEKWELLSDNEKEQIITDLVKTVGEELGIDVIPDIRIVESDDEYGYYDSENNNICLNSRFISDPIELVNTVTHELRHCYQHFRAEKMESWEDALYKYNFDNYISPLPLPDGGWLFFNDYYDQYVEVEARVFANKFEEAVL